MQGLTGKAQKSGRESQRRPAKQSGSLSDSCRKRDLTSQDSGIGGLGQRAEGGSLQNNVGCEHRLEHGGWNVAMGRFLEA